jgi:hypothetical protein
MLVLGMCLYLGFAAAEDDSRPRLFVILWASVMILMGLLVLLALIDVRFTVQLRNQKLKRSRGSSVDRSGPT